jgi:hypothetical protein
MLRCCTTTRQHRYPGAAGATGDSRRENQHAVGRYREVHTHDCSREMHNVPVIESPLATEVCCGLLARACGCGSTDTGAGGVGSLGGCRARKRCRVAFWVRGRDFVGFHGRGGAALPHPRVLQCLFVPQGAVCRLQGAAGLHCWRCVTGRPLPDACGCMQVVNSWHADQEQSQ